MTGAAKRLGLRALLAGLLLLFTGVASAQTPTAAAALHARHSTLQRELASNPFGQPLHLDSVQSNDDLNGEIYAVVDHSYAKVNAGLVEADHWCDILILHLNVKQCRSAGSPPASLLAVHFGSKHTQRLEAAQRVDFEFRVLANATQYLQILLHADAGPLATRNLRIMLEAIPLDAGRSFIHLSYSYGYGRVARLAMQGYLATIGSGKVGFGVVDRTPDGRPVYVKGERGVIERNSMRYYLAIAAYLGAVDLPAREQPERRLRDWVAATEQYPLQLRELSEREYLEMKRAEFSRQQLAGAR